MPVDICEKYNFKLDNSLSEFNQIFSNRRIDVSIDTYVDEPYMMLARVMENGVSPLVENGRFILRKTDRNKTVIMNIPSGMIEGCVTKMYSESHYQVLFKIHNVCIKMFTVLKN
jgi:hypothetical protein